MAGKTAKKQLPMYRKQSATSFASKGQELEVANEAETVDAEKIFAELEKKHFDTVMSS